MYIIKIKQAFDKLSRLKLKQVILSNEDRLKLMEYLQINSYTGGLLNPPDIFGGFEKKSFSIFGIDIKGEDV